VPQKQEQILFKRTRFQQGSLQRERRKGGPDYWVLRWRETDSNGVQVRRKTVVGTVGEYPTESKAQQAASTLRMTINQEKPRQIQNPITVSDLIHHFKENELRPSTDSEGKAYSTCVAYVYFLDHWILPRWSKSSLREVRTIAIEQWLRGLRTSQGRNLAPGTKAKIRNIMSALFNHAIRYEWLSQGKNPVTLVRQSAKRLRIPDVLEIEEIQALFAALTPRERALVMLVAITGLRRSELLGLKWSDIDFERLEISVTRAVFRQVVGPCKTEASKRPLPLDAWVAQELYSWRQQSEFPRPEDWVFASSSMEGKQPWWPDAILQNYIQPAAKRVGITKQIGFHTFRHTYSTLLKANGEDVKTVQELLRHASSQITLDIYTQAVSPAKRQAQTRIVKMLWPGPQEGSEPIGPLTDPDPEIPNHVSD
jgi:integrase